MYNLIFLFHKVILTFQSLVTIIQHCGNHSMNSITIINVYLSSRRHHSHKSSQEKSLGYFLDL